MLPLANAQADRVQPLIDHSLIDMLVKHQHNGDRLMFLRTHNGQIKVKIKYGPLKCRVKRFITNHETFEQIKQIIALKN